MSLEGNRHQDGVGFLFLPILVLPDDGDGGTFSILHGLHIRACEHTLTFFIHEQIEECSFGFVRQRGGFVSHHFSEFFVPEDVMVIHVKIDRLRRGLQKFLVFIIQVLQYRVMIPLYIQPNHLSFHSLGYFLYWTPLCLE